MKKLSVLLLVSIFISSSFAFPPAGTASTEKGIQFESITFQQALNKAQKEKKYIFMNVYATWCAPCMSLLKTTFKSDEVGNVLNKKFVNISVDAEKGEGIALAKRYQVTAHPLMLIINSDGKVVKRILGYVNDDQLFAQLKDYLK